MMTMANIMLIVIINDAKNYDDNDVFFLRQSGFSRYANLIDLSDQTEIKCNF